MRELAWKEKDLSDARRSQVRERSILIAAVVGVLAAVPTDCLLRVTSRHVSAVIASLHSRIVLFSTSAWQDRGAAPARAGNAVSETACRGSHGCENGRR